MYDFLDSEKDYDGTLAGRVLHHSACYCYLGDASTPYVQDVVLNLLNDYKTTIVLLDSSTCMPSVISLHVCTMLIQSCTCNKKLYQFRQK